jgi:hypothetical protein
MSGKPWDLKTVHDRCRDDGDCWTWTQGRHHASGHPQATIEGKGGQLVRRWVLAAATGRQLTHANKVVDSCGNHLCCNPDHLRTSTASAVLKRAYHDGTRSTAGEYLGRLRRAQSCGMAKLDMDKARDLRRRMKAGESIAALSRETGLWPTTLREIKHGRSWREQAVNSSVFAFLPKESVRLDSAPRTAQEQAGQRGNKTFEGVPCGRCEGVLRYVSDRSCVACKRLLANRPQREAA